MKQIRFFPPTTIFLLLITMLINTRCKKDPAILPATNLLPPDTATNNVSPYGTSDTPSAQSGPPVVYAGANIIYNTHHSYANEINLVGYVNTRGNNILRYEWKKIDGPNSCTIENAETRVTNAGAGQFNKTIITKVRSLDAAVYQFELNVADSLGRFGIDTVKIEIIKVDEIQIENPREIIFKDLLWISPWYNNVEVTGFIDLLPPRTIFKVLIQRHNSKEWIEVPQSSSLPEVNWTGEYDFFVETTNGTEMYRYGSLYVSYYGFDLSDNPAVKIVY